MGMIDFIQEGKLENDMQFFVLIEMGRKNLQGQARDDFIIQVCKSYLKLKGVLDK